MAKMIPSTIERNDPRRTGEYMVYDWMSNPRIPGYCFYSLPQERHPHKLIGEVDFLYICEKGMLCIEVKGGKEINRIGRIWYSVNKRDEENEIKDPFEQSRGCMFSLKTLLKDTYGQYSEEAKLQAASCVIFPECIAKCKGDGVTQDIMYDNRYDLSEFPDFLNNAIKYWADLEVEKHHGIGSNPLNQKQIKQMVDLLQADFGSVPSMKLEIQHIEDQMEKLTDEQLDIVDDMSVNKRIIVQGGAGTGKTLLALQKVRSSLSKHQKVLYLCFNRNMAQYAAMNLPKDTENLTVKTFHSFMGEFLGCDVHELSLEEVSQRFQAANKEIEDKFDVLVVDEGQDLMKDCVWETLDNFLQKGIEKGEWIVFTDPNQSIFTDSKDYEEGLDYLKELCDPTIWPLRKNWRNTAQIGRRTSRLTFVPPAKHMKIDGPKVVAQKVDGGKELVKQLKKDIASLLAGGTPAKNLVILSPRKLKNSAMAGVTHMCNMDVTEVKNLSEVKEHRINYYTVQSFKGLESSVVFYIDIDGFRSTANRKMNYVAMTRAKALLYMYIDANLENEYQDMMEDGLEILEG